MISGKNLKIKLILKAVSRNLYYKIVKPIKKIDLDDQLKFVIRERYGLEEGSYRLTEHNIDYLNGLKDAGIKDADKLISAIQKHEEIDIWLE